MRANCREQIANPAEPVNGQDERRKCAAIPRSRSITRPQATTFAQQKCCSKKERHPCGCLSFLERATRLDSLPASHEWQSHSQEPCRTSRFNALRAGRGSKFKPARGIPKRKHHPDGWCFFFCDCPQVLLSALPPTARKGECEGGTFDGFPHSRSITRPQATTFA